MNQIVDPRTFGFNYGPACAPDALPAVYHAGEQLAHALRQQANRIGARAWALDMVLRDVRLAGLEPDRINALAKLETELASYIPPALLDAVAPA